MSFHKDRLEKTTQLYMVDLVIFARLNFREFLILRVSRSLEFANFSFSFVAL